MSLYGCRYYEYPVEAGNTPDLREDGKLRSGLWSGFCKIGSKREGKRNQERRKGGSKDIGPGILRSCMGNLEKGIPEGMSPLIF